MRNKLPVMLPFVGYLFLLAASISAQGFDKLSLIGLSLDYNVRKGSLDFGGNHVQDIGKPSMITSGFVLGKRWRIFQDLRLQVSGNIKYGTVTDDTLPSLVEDGTPIGIVIVTTFLYGGCAADFQVPVSITKSGGWYLHAGGGGHIIDMNESERTLETPPRIVDKDPYPVSQVAVSASVHGGLGFEVLSSPRYGVAFEYTLRYWYPVHYPMSRDLFPYDPVHYHERFLSHELGVLLLVKRR